MTALALACGLMTFLGAQDDDFREQLEELRRMFEDRESKDFETEHYKLTAGRLTGQDLKDQLEAMFGIWQGALKTSPPSNKLNVVIHALADDYKRVAPPGTLAHYDEPNRTVLGVADAGLFNNLVREGTHQFLHATAPKAYASMPPWLKAGLTLYFSSVDVAKDKKLKMNDVLTRENFNNGLTLKKLMRDRKTISMRELVDEGDTKFETNARVRQVQAWGLVWWLYASGQGESVQKLLAAFEEGKPRDQAYLGVFGAAGKVDWTAIDSQCTTFWKNLKVEIPDRTEGDWLVGETEHYTVRVQKGAKNEKLRMADKDILKDMKFKMELLFEKYALAFRFEGKLSKRPSMRLYKSRGQYHASGGPQGSAAYYSPRTKELVGYEDSEETGIVFQIFCHEGCHQFFDLAFPGFYDSEDLPMWFSEGLADCLGSSEIMGRDLHVFTVSGVATWRADIVKEAIQEGRHPSISELLEMGRMPFMQDAGIHYAVSWSFCHFLWNSPNQVGGGGKYKEVVIKLIDGFKNGRPRDEVYREAFQLGGRPLDYGQLETEWKTYVKGLRVKAPKPR